jgi:uncharacterized membrane protein
MKPMTMLGLAALAGFTLAEAAMIPVAAVGAAATLAPAYLPKLRRRLQPSFGSLVGRQSKPAQAPERSEAVSPAPAAGGFAIKQALAKTITFRIIVTTLDFTTNYVVLGELATAAGLSAVPLVVGPVFYFVHETAWNRFGPPANAIDIQAAPALLPGAEALPSGWRWFTISRALAKTITFRTIATVMDFTTTYIVIGDLATAAGLSAFGFVVGPFVYLGHEMVWDYYASPNKEAETTEPAPQPG